jgi:hypothetical protein
MSTQNEMFEFIPSSFLAVPSPAVAERIRRQPECRLLWAVLENAVDAYMKYVFTASRRGKRLFREAEEWIWRDDPTWLCSFVSICNILGVDPDYVRRGLRQWREAQVASSFEQAA